MKRKFRRGDGIFYTHPRNIPAVLRDNWDSIMKMIKPKNSFSVKVRIDKVSKGLPLPIPKEDNPYQEGFDAGFAEAVRMLNSEIADEYDIGVGDSAISPAAWGLWLEEQRNKK